MVDTAPDYGNEADIGKAIRKSGVQREGIWVASKVDTDSYAKQVGAVSASNWTVMQVSQSLVRLGLEYVDIMYLHFGPSQVALHSDRILSMAVHVEMWKGLVEARRLGLVKHLGVCEHTQAEIQRLINETGEVPSVALVWYNPWTPPAQKHYINWLKEKDIAVLVYGLFNFKFVGPTEVVNLRIKAAEEAGAAHGVTYGQLVIQWLLEQGLGFATGLYHPEYLREDAACMDFNISSHDLAKLRSAPNMTCGQSARIFKQYMPGCMGLSGSSDVQAMPQWRQSRLKR